MNSSKTSDPRFWVRWRSSGAVSSRAPGWATAEDGTPRCACSQWARPVDSNMRKYVEGRAQLKHAKTCNGRGAHTDAFKQARADAFVAEMMGLLR